MSPASNIKTRDQWLEYVERIREEDDHETGQPEPFDDYMARLVKAATPAWEGVDKQEFLDEVRGRNIDPWPEIRGRIRDILRMGDHSELLEGL